LTVDSDSFAERHAWTLVAGLFAVLTISSGLGFYNLSIYMHALGAVRGLPVPALSACISIYFLSGGAGGLVVGPLLARRDARVVIAVGALVGGAAIALIGQARTPVALYAVYALFGLGNSAVGMLPATTLVTRWFDAKRRALALSVTSTGLSVGGVLLTPISATLLERLPIETAMTVLGAIYALAIAPIAALTVRSHPQISASARRANAGDSGVAFADAVRARFFRLFTLAYLLLMGSQVGGIAHLFTRGSEIVPVLDAAFAVSVLASLSITGRLLGGWLLSRLPLRAFTVVNMAGQAVGLLVMALADGRQVLWLGAGVFGFTVGNLLMLQPLILSHVYGLRDYPKIYSLNQAITTLGVAGGPLAIGLIRDAMGYETAFATMAATALAALAVFVLAGRLPRAPA